MRTITTEVAQKICKAIDIEILKQITKDYESRMECRLPNFIDLVVDIGDDVSVAVSIIWKRGGAIDGEYGQRLP